MQARNCWVLGGAAVLAALVLGASFGPRTAAQPRAPEPPPVGRYQPCNSERDYVMVIDTATGHVWRRGFGNTNWDDLGTPAGK